MLKGIILSQLEKNMKVGTFLVLTSQTIRYCVAAQTPNTIPSLFLPPPPPPFLNSKAATGYESTSAY